MNKKMIKNFLKNSCSNISKSLDESILKIEKNDVKTYLNLLNSGLNIDITRLKCKYLRVLSDFFKKNI